MFSTARYEEAAFPPRPLWAENRVWASGVQNTAFIGTLSWISSTSQWTCGYVCDGTASDRLVGLDYFGARYYGSSMGRFMSPDWSAKAMPIPYAKLGDPQTLNLYSYVGNDPLSRNDPTGHVLNCVSNQSQCGSDLNKIAPGTKVGADGTVQKGSLLQRIVNHLDGHGDGQALVTRLVNNSAVTGINPNSGDPNGGTAGNHTITYDPAGANGVLVRGADGNITTGHVSGADVLGHELIHEDHAERGTQDFSTAMHMFTDGGMNFGELGRSEEFRTVGFAPFARPGDITENQIDRELGGPQRATYTFDKNDFIPQPSQP